MSISNDDGASWVPLETVRNVPGAWNEVRFLVNAFVTPSDRVRLRFVASDEPNNSILESAVDEVKIEAFDAKPHTNVYGSAVIGRPLALHVSGGPGRWPSCTAARTPPT